MKDIEITPDTTETVEETVKPVTEGSHKMTLSVKRMKTLKSHVQAGATTDHPTSGPSYGKPWG